MGSWGEFRGLDLLVYRVIQGLGIRGCSGILSLRSLFEV